MKCLLVFVLCGVLTSLHFTTAIETVSSQNRVFEVDYSKNQFLKDGEPFRYVSGSLHYFRVPRAYWRDLLRKYRAAGLNAVCTYIEWSQHELEPGKYDFSGQRDFVEFVQLAQEEGLLVILRPGPYICAERDFGGYPVWLLNEHPKIQLRTSDKTHTQFVLSWLRVLLPKIQPLLYGNGGPVIMVQVENEYGSYPACDRVYTLWLRDVFRSYVGDKAVLFTTDGAGSSFLKCGQIPGVFTTVDFGPTSNVSRAFDPLRQVQPHGPMVNSEFYPGWLTHWGESGMASVSTEDVVNATRQLLQLNASFNFYMFHGGTNFGFTSGANNPSFEPQVTSYDYDAPISESGVLTEKYYAIRSVLSEYMPVPTLPITPRFPVDYGPVSLLPKASLWDTADWEIIWQYPQTMESIQVDRPLQLVLYETKLPSWYLGRGFLVANNTHDRAIVYVNEEPVGILSRADNIYTLMIGGKAGQLLWLLVENQGHINYGKMSDLKGLLSNVTLNDEVLTDWRHTAYSLDNVTKIPWSRPVTIPAFYEGTFKIPSTGALPRDTFVDMTGWTKGVVFVNGVNLGRYWPAVGPQTSLYLPGTLLNTGGENNTITILELEKQGADMTVRMVAQPGIRSTKSFQFVEELNADGSLKGITAV